MNDKSEPACFFDFYTGDLDKLLSAKSLVSLKSSITASLQQAVYALYINKSGLVLFV